MNVAVSLRATSQIQIDIPMTERFKTIRHRTCPRPITRSVMATLRLRRNESVHTMNNPQISPTMLQSSCVIRIGRLSCWPIRDWSGASSEFQQSGFAAIQSWSLSRRRRGTLDSESLGDAFRLKPEKTSRTMSRWIQHPALIWTLLTLFGLPNLLGQGFHIALHHAHGSPSTTGCAHAHSHAKTESKPAKKHACSHHRHSHADTTLGQRETKSPALSLTDATLGHDPHNCAACQYYSTAQALAKPVDCAVSQTMVSSLIVSSPVAVFCERYLASSPRGPPVA